MNQIIEAIKARRSCRSFSDKQVEEDALKEIIECGLMAPSGMNQQGLQLSVIQDKQVLQRIKEMVGRDCMYNAPTLIVVHAHKDYKYVIQDGSAAMENMYIAANALGYGACWINQLKDYYGHELLKELGLENHIITGCLALGEKLQEPAPRDIQMNRVRYLK